MSKNLGFFVPKFLFCLGIKLVLKNKIWGSAKKKFCSKGSLDPKRLGTPALQHLYYYYYYCIQFSEIDLRYILEKIRYLFWKFLKNIFFYRANWSIIGHLFKKNWIKNAKTDDFFLYWIKPYFLHIFWKKNWKKINRYQLNRFFGVQFYTHSFKSHINP